MPTDRTRERCAGSLEPPAERGLRSGVERGLCPECGAWFALRVPGVLHEHVNWPLRRAHLVEEGIPARAVEAMERNALRNRRTALAYRSVYSRP